MASVPQAREASTLEEFLRRPDIDEKPYLEFIDGHIEEKTFGQMWHSIIQGEMMHAIDDMAEPPGLGSAFPSLRCTFAGRSIVADIAFLLRKNITVDEKGQIHNETLVPPDILIEILSSDHAPNLDHAKLQHATAHGTALGVLIDLVHRTIALYRPGRKPERLSDDGDIEGGPVLPGFRLPVAEVFGWLEPGWHDLVMKGPDHV